MIELIRRLALAAGVAWGIWLVMWSPEAVFRVEAIDFAERYRAEYAPRSGAALPSVTSAAREFLRRNTNPGSAEAYRDRKLEHRLLKPAGDANPWFARAAAAGGLWLGMDDPDIQRYLDQMRAIRAVWLVSYLPTSISPNHFLEIRWETTPRESKAPRELVFPHREAGFAWMAAGLLLYLILPVRSPRPDEAHHDRVILAMLDAVAIFFFAVIFFFPLYLADSAAEALDNLAGGTGFFWAIAGLFLLRLLMNAAAAARRVSPTQDGLVFASFSGSRAVPLHQIRRAEPLLRRGEPAGLRLHLADGSPVNFDWSQMMNVEPARRALRQFIRNGG